MTGQRRQRRMPSRRVHPPRSCVLTRARCRRALQPLANDVNGSFLPKTWRTSCWTRAPLGAEEVLPNPRGGLFSGCHRCPISSGRTAGSLDDVQVPHLTTSSTTRYSLNELMHGERRTQEPAIGHQHSKPGRGRLGASPNFNANELNTGALPHTTVLLLRSSDISST